MNHQRKKGLVAILTVISMLVVSFSGILGNVRKILATEVMSPNSINYQDLKTGDVLENGVSITECADSSGNTYSFLFVDEDGNYLDGQRSANVTCPEKPKAGYQTKWRYTEWNKADYYKNLLVIYQTGEFVSTDGSKLNLYIQFDKAGIINIPNRKIDQLDHNIITTGDTKSIDYNGTTYSCKTEDLKNVMSDGTHLKEPDFLQRISVPIPYSVNYEAGDGTGTMLPSAHTYDQAQNLNASTFTRTGYTFANWKDNTTGITYVDSQSVTNLSTVSGSAITLTAQWNPNQYRVNYEAGGGTGTMQPSVHTYDQAQNLTTNTFTRTGYTFANWKDNTTGITYVDGQSVMDLSTASGSAITLTAQWNPISQGGNTPGGGSGNNPGGGSGSTTGGNTSDSTNTVEVTPTEKKTQEIITQIKKANAGTTVKIDLSSNPVLTADVLNAIQGKDITIELDLGNHMKWILNGLSITGTNNKDINFGVSLNTTGVPVKIINSVTGKVSYMQIQLLHEGEFGFKAVLEMNLNKENKGLMANLYYYNPQKDSITLQSAGKIDADGNVKLTFEHASDYIIVLAKTMLVKDDLKYVKVSPNTKQLKPNKQVQITYTLPESLMKLTKDTNLLTITYQSSNRKVAVVSATGKITAKKAGKAVIKATINIGGTKKTFKTVIKVK